MPDLKTALTAAITEWTKDDPNEKELTPMQTQSNPTAASTNAALNKSPGTRFFQPTNNVTRETFNFVRDNPGSTRSITVATLLKRGFVGSSVHSLIGQMVRQNRMVEHNGRLFTTANEFVPLKSGKSLAAMEERKKAESGVKRKYTRKVSTVIPAPAAAQIPLPPTHGSQPVVKPMKEPVFAPIPATSWTADNILEHLSIKEARVLFDELKKIFGG